MERKFMLILKSNLLNFGAFKNNTNKNEIAIKLPFSHGIHSDVP